MKTGMTIVAVAALLIGLLWIGQGTGLVRWPAASFMVDQRPWAVRGLVVALFGAGLLLWARRR